MFRYDLYMCNCTYLVKFYKYFCKCITCKYFRPLNIFYISFEKNMSLAPTLWFNGVFLKITLIFIKEFMNFIDYWITNFWRSSDYCVFFWFGGIHKPCGQRRGRGVPEKTMCRSTVGGGVRGWSTWTFFLT